MHNSNQLKFLPGRVWIYKLRGWRWDCPFSSCICRGTKKCENDISWTMSVWLRNQIKEFLGTKLLEFWMKVWKLVNLD